jgi:anti-sigma regulatory factor (Ser/Thr protein kinase)
MKKPMIIDNTIKIPSSQEYLVDVDSFLEGILRGFGVDESAIADIAISVTEIVNNGIIHGNRSDLEKEVTVTILKKNADLEITITDQGNGFDPGSVRSPIEDGNLMREAGRGIFIARSLMDTVAIDSSQNRGTRVTLTKRLF